MTTNKCKDIKDTYICSNCMEQTKADEWACDCSCIDCGSCVECFMEEAVDEDTKKNKD